MIYIFVCLSLITIYSLCIVERQNLCITLLHYEPTENVIMLVTYLASSVLFISMSCLIILYILAMSFLKDAIRIIAQEIKIESLHTRRRNMFILAAAFLLFQLICQVYYWFMNNSQRR